MDLEIKKDITSNWFKMLQEAIWHTITNLEKKDADIKTTVWNRSKKSCLLYTSPSPRDLSTSRMPSSA